ncbi:hypothetical protein [Pedobacter boryungensis]|uniref:DUF4377 domain-containing protein n=1 Tax=Pedobacter boryungensis TaxID=869962 RepID=A0ABX2DAB3_9SPHI|nr:hypothetical protein [Pedobacter boryungensis]NQX30139.1 hypothetical protein [Pedobacter boryungensis]
MKKLTLILICIATLGLASCKKDTIVQSANNLTIIKYIEPNQWKLSDDGYTYYATINESRIDPRTFEDDGILTYISRGDNNTYEQLPFVYNVDAYSYVIRQGSIEIDIQSSDNQDTTPIKPTTRTRVKIVLIESAQ